MPYMQRLTWSGIALHEGVVPGHPASHGCIRLPTGFASHLWSIGRVGMRVVVSPADVAPQALEHDRLPVPRLTPVAWSTMPDVIRTAAVGEIGNEQRLLDPYSLALAHKAKAITDRDIADKTVKPALELSRAKSAAATRATEELRKLSQDVTHAETVLAEKQVVLTRSQVISDTDKLAFSARLAVEQLEEARRNLTAAKILEAQKSDEAFLAARAARDAEAAAASAGDKLKLAIARLEPISIFVSRKERRMFVRQGFTPVHDEPILFSDPDLPLGTHVYTAIEGQEDGARLRWISITLPSNSSNSFEANDPPSRRRQTDAQPPQLRSPTSKASEALDRFHFSTTTLDLISQWLWPGTSLIVSDNGTGNETGKGTDFIVLTK